MITKNYINAKHGPFHDIKEMTSEELSNEYGIEIYENGNVWDPIEHKDFVSLLEWASYMVELEEFHAIPVIPKSGKSYTQQQDDF